MYKIFRVVETINVNHTTYTPQWSFKDVESWNCFEDPFTPNRFKLFVDLDTAWAYVDNSVKNNLILVIKNHYES